jgi:hypothetical protein
MIEKTFKVKSIDKKLDKNGKVEKLFLTVEATDKAVITDAKNILLSGYTVKQRN